MRVRSRARLACALVTVGGLVVAGCSSSDDDDDTATGSEDQASEQSCGVEDLGLVKDGTLTIGTDSPAFPPWFEDDDPTNGKGFESAVAYAVADELGFTKDQVEWTVVAFNNAFAPGDKEFDFDINQVSISPERDEAVDFSDGYYDVNQAIVGFADSEAADATTLDDLKGLKLGAQLGTTSLDFINDVIQPDSEAFVYNDNNAAKAALDAEQVDGIVLDLPTAFYVSAVEIEGTAVIGQFPASGDEPEQFGLVFEDGNPLRDCVNEALASLQDSGKLDEIKQEWLSDVVDAPVIPRSIEHRPAALTTTEPELPRPPRPAGPTRRALAERAQRRRAGLVAGVSTVVVFGLLATLVVSAPGWDDVRRSFFSWDHLTESLPDIVPAFWINVRVFVVAEAFILVLALLLALARSSRAPVLFPLRVLSTVYVDVLRGIPVLLVLFLLGFGVPALKLQGVPKDPVFWATVALVLSYSAYVSEVYRAGIDSVHESQRAAARSLGLTSVQAMRFVVLPQAVRRVIPPLLNDFIALQKETALVGVLGPIEAARQAQIYSSRTFNFTSYLGAALIFLAFTIPLTRLTDWLLIRQRTRISGGRLA